MMPSRTRSEARSYYNLKFDPGASTLDAPPPPREAQRPPGIELSLQAQRSPGIELSLRLSASVVDLCYRALDCRHVCTIVVGCALRCFPSGCLFSLMFGYLI